MIGVHRGPILPAGLPSPDVYFLPGYGRAASVANGGEWILLEAFDGAWQVPLILRTLFDGTKDATSPYGYSGAHAAPSLSPSQVQEAWSATVRCLQELGVISLLLRQSPLVPQASELPGLHPVVSGHPTIVLEPTDSDSAWSAMEGACRNKTRKALKNGYTGEVRPATGTDLAPGSDFRRLYEQTMQRLDAVPVYFFSTRYYEELLGGLGPNLLIAEARDQGGAVVSSTLLMRHEHRLHYHLAGSNMADARMGSNNLMLWTATRYAIEQGLSQFHLGGGISQRDGLFSFKSSFGGRELTYNVSAMIVDQQLYARHTKRRANELNTTTESLLATEFFPAYRARDVGDSL